MIAMDYNPSARKVAETAYQLAKTMNAEICIVHVVADAAYYTMDYSPIMGYSGFDMNATMKLADELKKEAGGFLDAAAKHLGDETITVQVLEGDTAEAILDYANLWKADIIVMGSHSRSGIDKLLMGNVAQKVLKHSHIPLFIIPTNKE